MLIPGFDPPSEEVMLSIRQKRPEKIALKLKTITPVFGGGARAGHLDPGDPIRAPSIRGQLRFWWRALYGGAFETSQELYRKEKDRWGGVNSKEEAGGRSQIDVRVVAVTTTNEETEINREEFYALFSAKKDAHTILDRYAPGVTFTLEVSFPQGYEEEIRNTLRAWILFGGYGSRTRRGVGSLTVREEEELWLPRSANRDGFRQLFGTDILAPLPDRLTDDLPLLAGAVGRIGRPIADGREAWKRAVGWLKHFRQGTPMARLPAPQNDPGRPGRSNWPEADKVRHLSSSTSHWEWSHPHRFNATPVWPRAGFGLPIVGQFQKKGRNPGTTYNEPENFQLRGVVLNPANGTVAKELDRLASPLILKAIPLADGQYVPLALWLNRGYPAHGQVVMGRTIHHEFHEAPGSRADFDQLSAPGDEVLFPPLRGAATLRDAFLGSLTGADAL